jgi:hypothetical protein
MVARLQVIYALAHFDDGPGRLMADRHGHWTRPAPVDHREIRVAEAGRGDLDQHFTWPRRLQLQRLNGERL